MQAEFRKIHLDHLEEQLLERTRVSEQVNCPRCQSAMLLTFKTPRTTTFRCEACGRHLSKQTLR
jgi:transposase-like protein